MLALPALPGEDAPKLKPDATPKELHTGLVNNFSTKQQAILAEVRKTRGEGQNKRFEKYSAVGKDFADQFYKRAEANPKDAIAAAAMFWIVQNEQ